MHANYVDYLSWLSLNVVENVIREDKHIDATFSSIQSSQISLKKAIVFIYNAQTEHRQKSTTTTNL